MKKKYVTNYKKIVVFIEQTFEFQKKFNIFLSISKKILYEKFKKLAVCHGF